MRRLTLLKIVLVSLLGSCLLCVLAFLSLRTIEDVSGSTHRQELAIRIAKEFESVALPDAFQAYVQRTSNAGPRSKLWAVDDKGSLLGATSPDPLPFDWDDRCKPHEIHEIAVRYSFMSLAPEFTCIRLDSQAPRYLVIHFTARRAPRLVWGTSFLFIFVTVAMAVFLALTLSFFYLQRKSREAKKILSRIEKGDLEARFQIQGFDEIGSLMLDFNRMADNMQKLILRVHDVENSRRHLLQELGHDVRTPLTSLRTSLETLRQSSPQMSPQDREEFLQVMEAELNYLIRLLEDLFFIADLSEPRFKSSLEQVNLYELISSELKIRQQSSALQWQFSNSGDQPIVMGDSHLLLRLFKNAFDNAGRFARSKVHVQIRPESEDWIFSIEDDGPGLADKTLAEFGHRRQNRIQSSANLAHLSLGLGSVIMKSIAEVHRGTIELQNILDGDKKLGARLTIRLHK